MIGCIIAAVIVAILIMSAIVLIAKLSIKGRDVSEAKSEESTMYGGAKKKNAKRTNNGRGKNAKTKRAAEKKTNNPKRKSALTNVHHNENAKYVFIYFGDIYPHGLTESSMFKSIINQTSFKNEAYAVYERATNGQWVDNLLFDDAWDDFEEKMASTFEQELLNGARLVLIGKGFGAFYSKIFKYKMHSAQLNFHKAIALNGMHLRELIPSLIMEKTGQTEINLMDIEFKNTECIYQGKDYVKVLGLNIYVYLLMVICDRINNTDYYSFYGEKGDNRIEIEPFNDVYENTFLIKYGKRFVMNDWLKQPKLLEAAIKEAI